MQRSYTLYILIVLVLVAILLICLAVGVLAWRRGLFAPRATEEPTGAVYTQAAATFIAQVTQQALLTQIAGGLESTPTPGGVPTFAPPTQPLPSPSATPSLIPTATQVFPTPLPPTATSRPVRCNAAAFIRDVTVPDGTSLAPGVDFTKVWRLQNVGSCTWDRNYSVVFVDGDRLSASRSVPLPKVVEPGETVDVGVEMAAPSRQGRYTGYWMLSSSSGEVFGIGSRANDAFWVVIRVLAPNENFAFDLAVNACLATWRSNAGQLPCPGDQTSRDGSVVLLDRPELEDGRRENESTLWTRPQQSNGGWIQGVYPAYKVREFDRFLAEIGCLQGNSGCELRFNLNYVLQDGVMRNLGSWYEKYDGKVTRIEVDLASLVGKSVQFVLSVENLGRPANANGFWLVPSVRRFPPTPTPTPTRTATLPAPTVTPTVTTTPTLPPDEPTPTPSATPTMPYPYPSP